MSLWGQVNIMESMSPSMKMLTSFHDYALGIILMILIFVSGISVFMVSNMLVSNSPIVTMVEVVWTTFPVLILILLAVPSLKILYFMEENDPFVTLKIMGHQWYWSYELMDFELNYDSYLVPKVLSGEYRLLEVDHRVVMPVSKDVQGLISASDVLHCWTVPSLGIKADAVPGRLNKVSFNILKPSIMFGQCSEICGANHSFMPITMESINLNYFLIWAKAI